MLGEWPDNSVHNQNDSLKKIKKLFIKGCPMCCFLRTSFWNSVMDWGVFPQTWSSRHDKQVHSFIYLYGIKAKPKPIRDFYYKNFLHKRKKKRGREFRYESKQMPHTFNKSIHLIHLARSSSLFQVISYHLRIEETLQLKLQSI